jgi:hypothetical protein
MKPFVQATKRHRGEAENFVSSQLLNFPTPPRFGD